MSTNIRNFVVLGSAFMLGLCLANCALPTTTHNSDHCFYAEGDATCKKNHDTALPYCMYDRGECQNGSADGCVAEKPLTLDCYSPCGEGKLARDDSSCIEVADESGDDESGNDSEGILVTDLASSMDSSTESTGDSSDTSDATDIDTTADDSMCECDDNFNGFCNDANICEYLCNNGSPCPKEAGCDEDLEECLPADAVYHVGPDLNIDMSFETLEEAMGAIGSQSATIILHHNPDGYADFTVSVATGQILAVRGAKDEWPELRSVSTKSCTNVDSYSFVVSGQLSIEHIFLRGKGGVLVQDNGQAIINGTQIVTTDCPPVNCTGLWLRARNSMLGQTDGVTAPINLLDGCSAALNATTIYAPNTEILTTRPAIACSDGNPGVNLRNNLFYSNADPHILCNIISTHDNKLLSWPSNWFVNAADGDLHVNYDMLNMGRKMSLQTDPPSDIDPSSDIDGHPRTPNYAGADVPF
ncbi:MAG: hypothetical protein HC927_00900 [Deltaproteobacteria bacterium]|nr:hypothetical protein [Deltaproteobacteria bacterium]